MIFKFTLTNTIEGPLVLFFGHPDPGGWDEASKKLERHDDYDSLIETFNSPLTYVLEARAYIVNIENTQGPDAQIRVQSEISEDGDTFDSIFDGLFAVITVKDFNFYKLDAGTLRDDFWQKFINRVKTPVDLSAAIDLDGNARTAIAPFTLNLSSQIVNKHFVGELKGFNVLNSLDDGPWTIGQYFSIGVNVITLDEFNTKYQSQNFSFSKDELPKPAFPIDEAGHYVFNLRIEMREIANSGAGNDYPDVNLGINLRKNGNVDIPLTVTRHSVTIGSSTFKSSVYTLTFTDDLVVGDEIRIYGVELHNPAGSGDLYIMCGNDTSIVPSGISIPTYWHVDAATTFPDSTVSSWLIREAAESIISKLVGQDLTVKSNYLTAPGCAAYYGIFKGVNARGWSLANKPFKMSMEQWYSGLNPLLCLGLGYKTIGGVKKIVIERKRDFYKKSPNYLTLDWVNNITRSYDPKRINKLMTFGFSKWSAESGSGIDDTQTVRVMSDRFQTIGSDITHKSTMFGASLGIEETRRQSVDLSKDYRLDEDIMIVALNKTDHHYPELAENFTSITGLLNYATRYNIRLSAMRVFKRWQRFLQGCLQWYIGTDYFKFSSGEGNTDMVSTLSSSDCEGDDVALSEKGNIAVDNHFDFKPILYEFEHHLTKDEYDLVLNNPEYAIAVSRTDANHKPCHIISLEWFMAKSKAKFVVLLAGNDPIDEPASGTTTTQPATTPPVTTTEPPTTTTTEPATTSTEPVSTTTGGGTTTEAPCINYRLVNNSDVSPAPYQYDDCSGTHIHATALAGGTYLFCAREGTIVPGPGTDVTITNLGPCGSTTTTTPVTTTTGGATTTTTAAPECRNYRMQNNSDVTPAGLQYEDCFGFTQHITLGAGATENHCALVGSVVPDGGTDITIVDLGPCG